MQTPIELEKFIKNGFKLLRCTKDPSSVKTMLKPFEDAVQKQYGGNRQPKNAAEKLAVPTTLFSKALGKGQTKMIVDDECNSSRSPSCAPPTTSNSIAEVCSSPPPTVTLEQVKQDPAINNDTDSEMVTEDIESCTCCVCKESFAIVGNSLKECFDCHSMYHRNCHTPPVTGLKLNDQQIIWYCTNCRPRDGQQKVERSSRKESKKSSSKSTTGAKSEKTSSSKTSQSVKGRPRKSKPSSEKSRPKHCLPSDQPVTSAVEKRVEMMKRKRLEKPKKNQ